MFSLWEAIAGAINPDASADYGGDRIHHDTRVEYSSQRNFVDHKGSVSSATAAISRDRKELDHSQSNFGGSPTLSLEGDGENDDDSNHLSTFPEYGTAARAHDARIYDDDEDDDINDDDEDCDEEDEEIHSNNTQFNIKKKKGVKKKRKEEAGDNKRGGIYNWDEMGVWTTTTATSKGTILREERQPAEGELNDDPRKHWMPDALCKHCYGCELPFTVFRRRHHCRLCGQVFCSACSSYFVEVESPSPLSSSVGIRTCRACHEETGANSTDISRADRSPQHKKLDEDELSGSMVETRDVNKAMVGKKLKEVRANSLDYPVLNMARKQQEEQQQQQQKQQLQQQQQQHLQQRRRRRRRQQQNNTQQERGDGDEEVDRLLWADHECDYEVFEKNDGIMNGSGKKRTISKNDDLKQLLPTMEAMSPNPTNKYKKDEDVNNESHYSLGEAAVDHLERITRELLASDAPLLVQEFPNEQNAQSWVDTLLMLVTKACASVTPDVQNGDSLDIRPYCKIKVIPGGSPSDCACVSGVVFRKNVSHKDMIRPLLNPRIMLLSGGIEYYHHTRSVGSGTGTSASVGTTANPSRSNIVSFDTLLEQEEKYMELLVGKIATHRPDVLLVGRGVNRVAQERLRKQGVVLIQHVKATLMPRIARQTGATILKSVEHMFNHPYGSPSNFLGSCSRFRLMTFRDCEAWRTRYDGNEQTNGQSYHERQVIRAGQCLGEGPVEGSEAVHAGLSKRGMAATYVMLEGCRPRWKGCTLVLRGASKASLKQAKRVLRFLIYVGYHLRLETQYLRERKIQLPPVSVVRERSSTCSVSLCVDYGRNGTGRKVRPWNGESNSNQQDKTKDKDIDKDGKDKDGKEKDRDSNGKMTTSLSSNKSNDNLDKRSISGQITAFEHQSILITSVWMTGKTQCCPAEVKGICYYSSQDVSLGQFLRDSCFNLDLKCQNPSCKKSVLEHTLSFIHNSVLINIALEHMEEPLMPPPHDSNRDKSNTQPKLRNIINQDRTDPNNDKTHQPIATWTYCQNCKTVGPLIYISDDTWRMSFGKFIEIYFYNSSAVLSGCGCPMQSAATLYFGCGRLAARFSYEPVRPYGVVLRQCLPTDEDALRAMAVDHLHHISIWSSSLFVKFDKHMERVSREARNVPPGLGGDLLLEELGTIGTEVDHAAVTLQERIAASVDYDYASLLRFPWHARRYLALVVSVWNERLSAVGQALSALEAGGNNEQGGGTSGVGGSSGGNGGGADDTLSDEIGEKMRRVRQLHKLYSRYDVGDMDILSYSEHIASSRPAAGGEDRRYIRGNRDRDRIRDRERGGTHRRKDKDSYYSDIDDDEDIAFEDDDMLNFSNTDFESDIMAEGSDFDVNASRRRHKKQLLQQQSSGSIAPRPTKSLGTRRHATKEWNATINDATPSRGSNLKRHNSSSSSLTTTSSPYEQTLPSDHKSTSTRTNITTPGVAVKSALTRFFNRMHKDIDPYVVDMGVFSEGRVRLEPGAGGLVVPIYDSQPSTVVAHSLASEDYRQQFRDFLMEDNCLEENNMERRMLIRSKTHIKNTFKETDIKGQQICRFTCTTFWATQFDAVRKTFLSNTGRHSSNSTTPHRTSSMDLEEQFIHSLSSSRTWAASGGKSGASFSLTSDGRFVIKCISRTELAMFLDTAPAYFEYLSKAFFHGLPSVLCKIVGVYQIGSNDRITGKRTMDQVTVMQNIFYGRKVSHVFDLKGSLRGRFAKFLKQNKKKQEQQKERPSNTSRKQQHSKKEISKRPSKSRDHGEDGDDDSSSDESTSSGHSYSSHSSEGGEPKHKTNGSDHSDDSQHDGSSEEGTHTDDDDESGNKSKGTLLDGDFLEYTKGRPLPLNDRAKAVFHMSILNDTLFLSIINVIDYSILVGIDEENMELVVGIIDFMRQYDILKQMERVGKSLPMVVGSEAPTIIQPPHYKARFTNAMLCYFMTVPTKWTTI